MEQDVLNNSFSHMASQLLDQWLSKEGRSIRAIEYYSGVCRNYIKRLIDKEIPDQKLDVIKVYKILKTVCGEKDASNVLLQNQNTRQAFLDYIGLPEKFIPLVKMNTELEMLVRDKEVGLVFILAANSCGTNLQQINNVCGGKGLLALNKLLEKEYVVLKEDRILIAPEYAECVVSFERDTYKHLLASWIGEYRSERAGTQWNYIAGITEGVNRDFHRTLHRKMDEFRMWVSNEMKKDSNKGDIPLFVALAMDSFTTQDAKQGVLQ